MNDHETSGRFEIEVWRLAPRVCALALASRAGSVDPLTIAIALGVEVYQCAPDVMTPGGDAEFAVVGGVGRIYVDARIDLGSPIGAEEVARKLAHAIAYGTPRATGDAHEDLWCDEFAVGLLDSARVAVTCGESSPGGRRA